MLCAVNKLHIILIVHIKAHLLPILGKEHSDKASIKSVCIDTTTYAVAAVTLRTKLLTNRVAIIQPVDRKYFVIYNFVEIRSDAE